MKPKYLISIVGATAIGKTALSIQLARHFKTDIISCDSRQFYREMKIGTAVPKENELRQVRHHLIQNRSIMDEYSVGAFEQDAMEVLDQLFKKHNLVVMVGGSGLYVDAVLNGLDDFPDVNPKIRMQLKNEIQEFGIKVLQDRLKKMDLMSYQQIDIDNPQRLIRALEICIGTGKPYSSFLNNKKNKRNFVAIKIGIKAERTLIYERINSRVDQMLVEGLLGEAKELYKYKNLNALQTVGYKELFKFMDDEINLNDAISEIKKNTRRFAKRQGTWFRRDKEIEWFEYPVNVDDVTSYIQNKLS